MSLTRSTVRNIVPSEIRQLIVNASSPIPKRVREEYLVQLCDASNPIAWKHAMNQLQEDTCRNVHVAVMCVAARVWQESYPTIATKNDVTEIILSKLIDYVKECYPSSIHKYLVHTVYKILFNNKLIVSEYEYISKYVAHTSKSRTHILDMIDELKRSHYKTIARLLISSLNRK